MPLLVNEIFFSLQGESSYAGWPCVFVRLTGCNLRCSWCDTTYAYEEGRSMSVEEIVRRLSSHPCELAEITGGEPLLQPESTVLADALLDGGYTVLVETNGSLDISLIDERTVRIVDFKCPSSGMEPHNDYGNIDRLAPQDEVKLVLADRADYRFAAALANDLRSRGRDNIVHFSPVWGALEPRDLARWILDDGLKIHLSLQLHKAVWGPQVRGV